MRLLWTLMIIFAVTACSPVVEDTFTREQNIWQLLRQVKVVHLTEYRGQLLQQEIETGLNSLQKNAPHRYDLNVDFSTKNIGLTGRNSFQATANIKLYRVENGDFLHESQLLAQSRYSNAGTDYQQEKSRTSAETRAIKQLARQIVQDIQNYFLAAIERDDL